ncbi:hypothetical protein HK097_005921 [Rhizophlyctis rosea]|uniref:NTF2-domain-containing protein n=1 Tax=Rhizophlyctis rosea TaxID=64517 RepID=A0AAD5X307_9FUNG|nr:hypothetical protein HK097_005921 [Rhizophlyctis rosea]
MTAAVANQTTNSAPAAPKPKIDAFEVGWLFVQEYYTFLNREPHKLHCFYNKNSSFSHGHEGDSPAQCHGQQEIHKRILELDFQDCKVLVSNIEVMSSISGGVVVQVIGEMSNKGEPSHKFAQTFFLAEQPNGYYVLNDIFRFLKEDIDDNNYEDNEEQEAYDQEQFGHEESTPAYQDIPAALSAHEPESPKHIEATRSPSPVKQEPAPVPEPVAEPEVAPEQPELEAQSLYSTDVAEAKPAAHLEPEVKKAAPARSESPAPPAQAAPAKASPAPAANEPAKPKTWASLAAANAGGWQADAPAKAPAATPAKQSGPSTPPAAPKTTAAVPKPAQKKAEDAPEDSSAETGSDSNKDGGFREVRRNDQRRPQQQHHDADEREKYSIYLKGINDKVEQEAVKAVFAKFGDVKKVELLLAKNIGFVEFTSPDVAQKVIGQTFTVNGQTIIAEERRKRVQNNRGNGFQRRDFQDGQSGRGRGGDFYGRGGAGRGRGGPRDGANGVKAPGPKPQPQGTKSQ